MTFTTTSVYSYKTTSVYLIVAFTNCFTDCAENDCRVYRSAHIRYRKPSDRTNGDRPSPLVSLRHQCLELEL